MDTRGGSKAVNDVVSTERVRGELKYNADPECEKWCGEMTEEQRKGRWEKERN